MDTERILNTLFTLSHHQIPLPFNITALAEEQFGNETGKSNMLKKEKDTYS